MKNAVPRIILELPAEGVREVYPLMIPIKPGTRDEEDKEEYNPITDLISTVEVIVDHMLSENLASHFGDEKEGVIRNLKKARNRKEGLEFVSAVRDFNVLMRKFKESGQMQACAKRIKVPSIELSSHILYQVYSRTVAPQADSLKEYEAFSNQVYGEINPILISEFIERTGIQSNHVFLDMGCGIGNVVLQVAAQTGCESHGIEIMDIPARLAKLQLREFKARMRYYHISHGHVNILHGDFLESPEIVDILRRVDVVLVNNYAFDSDLNQRLLQLFLDLKEGTKIITLKSYVPLDHKITLRNAASVESILTVQRYPYWSESVSWTNNGGEYFIHTVDRKPLHEFWKQVEENGGIDAAAEGPVRRTTRSRK
ncbi:DOT1-domain-containing protein [Basidiobolus meristosporus CBS 931.73]|uniref:Histone-lysine N-methyltransferase, H3 lysine-79 specific n=1 Tax=Basidiobolus meristosporus CBS 931.73 TaxID=1314790 RepID=A0A1Y1XRE7_9FUNG|nr:DOT1-domain-containing protein [Basidiobolus meristosporus CBS 931.73]|eukprot:ORX88332.1 DOT1-domain-containing protein [Basidiobolus meristosporus CBS 931.73]